MISVKSVAKQIQSNTIGLVPKLSNMDSANSRSFTAGQAANLAIQVFFLIKQFNKIIYFRI